MANFDQRNNKNQQGANPNAEGAKSGEDRKPTRIKIEPVEMEGTVTTKLISSTKLCAMINKVMRGISPDYDGSRIQVIGNRVACELFFSENPHAQLQEGQIHVIERRDANTGRVRDFASVIERYNRRNRATQYELTEKGKEAFSEFIPAFLMRNQNEADWNRAVNEDCEQGFAGQNKIYVKMQFDLGKFLRKVYGGKAPNGSSYIYEINIARPLDRIQVGNGNFIASKWLLSILQLDDANVREAYEDSGLSPMNNTLGIIR